MMRGTRSVQLGNIHLATTVGRLCKEAGFEGFYSNHSLRATCATRLFQNGVDEQLIARTTGHRSNAVRNYKRVNDDQQDELSRIVQGRGLKQVKFENGEPSSIPCNISTTDGSRFEIAVNISLNK